MPGTFYHRMRNILRRRWSRGREIDPSEIFIDAHNLPDFDRVRFEGKLEQPIHGQTLIYIGFFCFLVFMAMLIKVWHLQVVSGDQYTALSEKNRLHNSLIFAERGIIYDRSGKELAWNVADTDATTSNKEFSLRAYTTDSGFAHILGYVSIPKKDRYGFYYKTAIEGVTGIEKTYDAELAGEQGLKIVETDALGHRTSESLLKEPVHGNNITLSIDARVQSALNNFIRDLANEIPFEGGAGAIMDVQTGELIALTSFPEFDINTVMRGDVDALARYQNDPSKPFLNRAVGGVYTPGSIVKPFLAIAALNEGIISESQQILSTGELTLANPYDPNNPSRFADWRAQGLVDMRRALAVSSDVYFYEIGGGYGSQQGLGIRRIDQYAQRFGFGAMTGITLPGEAKGVIPTPEWKEKNFKDGTWRIGDTYHTAIGQYGFQVTLLQALRAIAGIATRGTLPVPHLTLSSGKEKSEPVQLNIPKEYFTVVQEGMRMGVRDGTAKGLDVGYVPIAAKTGTAELDSKKEFVNSWSVGFFPYDHPRYAFAIMMEKGPHDNTIGATFVMRRMLDWMHENTPEYLNET